MQKGVQLSNQPQSYFVTDLDIYHDSSQPAKEYNYNQCTLTQIPKKESHDHHILIMY